MGQNHLHYQNYLDLRLDGRIVLYKRADHQDPEWTVRLKIPDPRVRAQLGKDRGRLRGSTVR